LLIWFKTKACVLQLDASQNFNEFWRYIQGDKSFNLWLFTKTSQVRYSGTFTLFGILRFVKQAISKETKIYLKNEIHFSKALKDQEYFFLFTGSKQSELMSRISFVLSGLTNDILFSTFNTGILEKKNLHKNQLYFVDSANGVYKQFKTDFSETNLKTWVLRVSLSKYKLRTPQIYDQMKAKITSYLVLVIRDASIHKKQIEAFIRFEKIKDFPVESKVCVLSKLSCRKFLLRVGKVKFTKLKLPVFFMIRPASESTDDHVFWFSLWLRNNYNIQVNQINFKHLNSFVNAVVKGEVKPALFSNPNMKLIKDSVLTPMEYSSFKSQIKNNSDKHLLILFFNSRQCYQSCQEQSANMFLCNSKRTSLKMSSNCGRFLSYINSIILSFVSEHNLIPDKIQFKFFDLGWNSYDFIKIKQTGPFIRLYFSKDEYFDLEFKNNQNQFENKFKNFMGSFDIFTTKDDQNDRNIEKCNHNSKEAEL
jgi:hypothetical protein